MRGDDEPGRRSLWWMGKVGSVLLTVGIGSVLLGFPLTRTLEYLGYDLFYGLRGYQTEDRIVMVQLDVGSARQLLPPGAPLETPPNRGEYANLLRRLTAMGARAVFFDIVFRRADPQADPGFAAAIAENGRVILAARIDRAGENLGAAGNTGTSELVLPTDMLRHAAAGVGLINVPKDERDGLRWVRRLPLPEMDQEPAMSVVARVAGERPTLHPAAFHLANFRGPPGHFEHLNLVHALETPRNFASNRIVLIGARPQQNFQEADWFATPYQRLGHGRMSGVEIQANFLSNLIDGDPIAVLGTGWQLLFGALCGVFLSAVSMAWRPGVAALAVLGVAAAVASSSWVLQWEFHHAWTWLVPVAVQAPLAFVWSVGFKYFVLERHGRQLRKAFGAYLSPAMAARIAESRFSLELGGTEVEATLMFTDLEGFTSMSESLAPSEVSRLLVAYFDHTTGAILRRDGTIVKYIGDAVMAVWGAPLPDERHPELAVLAAWEMCQAGEEEIAGRHFHTRIGINTGRVLSGNLGSKYRFDYTCIGDATNFAARLEGMNKMFDTKVLLADATVARLTPGRFVVRRLGCFVAKGKTVGRRIYELLGPADSVPRPPWLDAFDSAVRAFETRQWDEAASLFAQVDAGRVGGDGPSRFYLAQVAHQRAAALPKDWSGEIWLLEK